eukprot:1867839-Rhodomonas_salina.2
MHSLYGLTLTYKDPAGLPSLFYALAMRCCCPGLHTLSPRAVRYWHGGCYYDPPMRCAILA